MAPHIDQEAPQYAGDIFARRLMEVRKRRGWSQTELATRLEDHGRPFLRQTIAKLETPGHSRARNVPLEDVLAIAAVLGVAPVHMFVPLEDSIEVDDEHRVPVRVKIFENLEVTPRTAREWVRGRGMVIDTNQRLFYAEMPEHERNAMLEQSEDAAAELPGAEPIGRDYFEPTTDDVKEN